MIQNDYNQLGVQADVNANFKYWLNDAINQDEYEEMIFFYHKDHLGSSTQISDNDANIIQHIEYLPYGETFFERRDYWNTPYKFNAKELDEETGMYYYGARYYTPEVSIWLSVDPLADKYPSMSAFMYCAGNPMRYIDPDGMDWEDSDGNTISDDQHKKIKVYIFYDSSDDGFTEQSMKIAKDFEGLYGKGTVALSDAATTDDFSEDWGDMSGEDISAIYLNYHGSNQTLYLSAPSKQYITSTGDGKTNISGTKALNVQDLVAPKGNMQNAALFINSCKSNNKYQHTLKGTKQTLMEGFRYNFDFRVVRGSSVGVSYSRITKHPVPAGIFNSWDYMYKGSSAKEIISNSRKEAIKR